MTHWRTYARFLSVLHSLDVINAILVEKMSFIKTFARLPVSASLFILALIHRPSAAARALGARLTGKKVRALNILRRATSELPFLYQIWLQKIEPHRKKALLTCDTSPPHARIIVCLAGGRDTTPKMLAKSRASVASFAEKCDLVLVTARSCSLNDITGLTRMNWFELNDFLQALRLEPNPPLILMLRAGDQLSEGGHIAYLDAWRKNPDASLIYGDEDEINVKGERNSPWFKPDWNPEQFLCQDFVSAACAIPVSGVPELTSILHEPVDPAQALVYATALSRPQLTAVHIPLILCHRASDRVPEDDADVRALLAAHLPSGTTVDSGIGSTRRIGWPLPSVAPIVTVIIPTRDQLALLRQCIAGLDTTDYPSLEIIVIDNDTTDPATLNYLKSLKDINIRVISYPGAFNFAAMNNRAAEISTGSLLCFVNNDIEFPDPSWLTALVRQGIRPHIGAVGAKLLYPDHTIQHAGVAIGIGGAAGHIHKHKANGADGCHVEPHVQRNVSAVTAACLLVARNKFIEVGGFDEKCFEVAFNDVDLCLKLQAAGYSNLYTPHAVAIHHESKSRGSDLAPANVDRYRRELAALQLRWGTKHARDRNWNINLDYACEQMSIRI